MKEENSIYQLSEFLPVYTIVNGVPILLKTEETISDEYVEGSKTEIKLNRYERDEKARKKCLEIYGYVCKVCSINFEQKYGELGKGFIHVHHKIPVSKIGAEYKINPEIDLIPVCPNCHAMLHRNSDDEPITIEELKRIFLLSNNWNNVTSLHLT